MDIKGGERECVGDGCGPATNLITKANALGVCLHEGATQER